MKPLRIGIVGGGWAGLAAAVRATEAGHHVTVLETARQWGGRARTLHTAHGAGLDNGQHILIGAYTATLGLMRRLGVDVTAAFHTVPLALRFADGGGLAVPTWAARWPIPLDVLAAITTARGWSWRDKLALLRTTAHWQRQGFACAPDHTVAQLCAGLPPHVVAELLEPLCLSALNTPLDRASASVFLRVLQDAMFGPGFGGWRGADLLLPKLDMGALLPQPAAHWLQRRGADLRLGQRVHTLSPHPQTAHVIGTGWTLNGEPFNHVILACPAWEAARLLQPHLRLHSGIALWHAQAHALRHEAIATVYTQAPPGTRWPGSSPILALRSGTNAPAQFVFDRGQLGGPAGQWAFVASACSADKTTLESQTLTQAAQQLGTPTLKLLQTVVEKRATFACTPGLQRPGLHIAPSLWAAGDHIDGPYPATLEGAVRSGQQAVNTLLQPTTHHADRKHTDSTPKATARK